VVTSRVKLALRFEHNAKKLGQVARLAVIVKLTRVALRFWIAPKQSAGAAETMQQRHLIWAYRSRAVEAFADVAPIMIIHRVIVWSLINLALVDVAIFYFD
jgi:hypothetical protein